MIVEEGISNDEKDYEEEIFEEAFNGNNNKLEEDGFVFEEDKHQTKLNFFLKLSKSSNVKAHC